MRLGSVLDTVTKKVEQIPIEWEQDVAEMYVNKRQLVRPNTNIKTVLIFILLFVLATSIFTWLVYYIILTIGVISYFPSNIQSFFDTNPILSIIIVCVFVELVLCFKYAIIGAIKLYQHYAPEEIRRRCLFMPTCSEYAILATRKYGGVIGLCKTYFRLIYRCKGNIYQIDYP